MKDWSTERFEPFIAAMHYRASKTADDLAARFDLSGVKRLLDVAGGKRIVTYTTMTVQRGVFGGGPQTVVVRTLGGAALHTAASSGSANWTGFIGLRLPPNPREDSPLHPNGGSGDGPGEGSDTSSSSSCRIRTRRFQ